MGQVYLHVGLHKTGTTFLQHNVFPFLSNIHYAGKYKFQNGHAKSEYPFNELIRMCYKANGYKFNHKRLTSIYNAIKDFMQSRDVLYSQESIVRPSTEIYYDTELRNIHLLKKLIPYAKIILCIRRQDTWIESMYVENYVKQGWPFDFDQYLDYYNNRIDEALDWKRIIDLFISLFGKENVLVLPYELFKENQDNFLDSLFDFMRTNLTKPIIKDQVNQKKLVKAQLTYPLQMQYEHWARSLPHNIIRPYFTSSEKKYRHLLRKYSKDYVYKVLKFSDKERNAFICRFRDSNIKLDELVDINLGNYNYY